MCSMLDELVRKREEEEGLEPPPLGEAPRPVILLLVVMELCVCVCVCVRERERERERERTWVRERKLCETGMNVLVPLFFVSTKTEGFVMTKVQIMRR